MTTTDITVKPEPVRTLTVDLLGITYTITPPKAAMALKIARMATDKETDALTVIDHLYKWLDKAFGKQSAKVKKRLDSDNDPLDYPHLITLVKGVVERQSGDPTT